MSFTDWQKPSCCNIVKYSSLLYLGTFLSPLSHCFGSAGIVTPPRGGNRPQRKYESLDEYLDGFRHTGGKRPLCNFRIVVGGSYFPGGRRLLFSTRSSLSTASLFFLLKWSVKIWRKFGKIRLALGVYVPLPKIKCLRLMFGGGKFALARDITKIVRVVA